MRTPGGYATIIDPDAKHAVQEFDTFVCAHCPSVQMTKGPNGKLEVLVYRADGSHYMKEAGFCRSCFQHICPACIGKPCFSRFKRLDQEEAAFRKFICAGA